MSDKAKRVISLLKDGKTPKEVAKLLSITTQNVYNIKYQDKKRLAQARKNKVVSRKQKPKEVYRWVQVDKVDPQATIESLKHEIVGYKAVISYLEHRLGLSSTQ